jgi:hypothetical protein
VEVNGQVYDPAALPPEKKPWHGLNRKLVGPQRAPGRFREEKNLFFKKRFVDFIKF